MLCSRCGTCAVLERTLQRLLPAHRRVPLEVWVGVSARTPRRIGNYQLFSIVVRSSNAHLHGLCPG